MLAPLAGYRDNGKTPKYQGPCRTAARRQISSQNSGKTEQHIDGRSMKAKEHKPLNDAEYAALSEFRYQIRKYLRYMEDEAREMGHNPQQYQVLLAIKGLPTGTPPNGLGHTVLSPTLAAAKGVGPWDVQSTLERISLPLARIPWGARPFSIRPSITGSSEKSRFICLKLHWFVSRVSGACVQFRAGEVQELSPL